MKQVVFKSLMGLALIAVVSGCTLLESADDITFDLELNHTFVVDENNDSQGQSVTYVDSDSWDPTTEPEFNKYKDHIEQITVNKVTYTVTDFQANGDVLFTNGRGKFKATAGSADALGSATITIQSIQGAVGGTHELTYAVGDLNNIAAHLKKIEPIHFEVSGTLSKTPVEFKVPVKIHCTIKASALD